MAESSAALLVAKVFCGAVLLVEHCRKPIIKTFFLPFFYLEPYAYIDVPIII